MLFNRVGPRIYAAGDRPLPDVIEQSRNSLDVSLRLPVAGAFSARIDAKNLLDAAYVVQQGTVTREKYQDRPGRPSGTRLAPVNASGVTSL